MGHRMSGMGRLRAVLACVIAVAALCVVLPTSARAATTITKVDVGNVWKGLVVGRQVAFTGEVNPNSECASQMKLADEVWQKEGTADIICREHHSDVLPVAGGTYYYGVVLEAEDGYAFPSDASGFEVIVDGRAVSDYHYDPENGGKGATIYFTSSIRVTPTESSQDESVITSVELTDVRTSYALGDAPVASAVRAGQSASDYEIVDECWTMSGSYGATEIAPQWHSSSQSAVPADKLFSVFGAGDYWYGAGLQAVDGKTFAADCVVTVNGETVKREVYNGGKSLRIEYKIINIAAVTDPVTPAEPTTPTTPTTPAAPTTGGAASGNGDAKAKPAAAAGAKADGKGLPQTGDEAPALVAGAALLAGCVLVAAGRVLVRER